MDDQLSETEKQILKSAVKAVAVSLCTFLLARNITQLELPVVQLSLVLGAMACFQSMFTIAHLTLALLLLQVLFPAPLMNSVLQQLKAFLN